MQKPDAGGDCPPAPASGWNCAAIRSSASASPGRSGVRWQARGTVRISASFDIGVTVATPVMRRGTGRIRREAQPLRHEGVGVQQHHIVAPRRGNGEARIDRTDEAQVGGILDQGDAARARMLPVPQPRSRSQGRRRRSVEASSITHEVPGQVGMAEDAVQHFGQKVEGVVDREHDGDTLHGRGRQAPAAFPRPLGHSPAGRRGYRPETARCCRPCAGAQEHPVPDSASHEPRQDGVTPQRPAEQRGCGARQVAQEGGEQRCIVPRQPRPRGQGQRIDQPLIGKGKAKDRRPRHRAAGRARIPASCGAVADARAPRRGERGSAHARPAPRPVAV